MIPPGFNDCEHLKQLRTKGGQHCKRLRTNVPVVGFTGIGNGDLLRCFYWMLLLGEYIL